MMHKKIYYIVGLLIILLISAPLIDGMFFKRNIFKVIKIINEDERIKLEVLSYQEGWFTSHAKIRVTVINKDLNHLKQINVPKLNLAVPINFILEENIQHGPITFKKVDYALKLGYAYIKSNLVIEKNNIEIMKVKTLVGFNGNWSGLFYSPMLSFSLPTIEKVTIAGLKGNFLIELDDKKINRVRTDMQTGAILISGDADNTFIKQVSIEPLKSRYDAVHEKKGLWSGSSSAYTPGIIIANGKGIHFMMDKCAINSTFSLGKNVFYNSNLTIFIRNAISPNHTMPAFSKLQIRFSANNFNMQGLNKYVNFIKSRSPEDIQKNIDLEKLQELLAHTISPTSTLEAFASADTSLGSFSIYSKSIWPPHTLLPNTIAAITKHSYTTINIRLSNSLVVKLLTIYGDEIMATSDAQIAASKKQGQALAQQFFQNQRTESNGELHQKIEQLLKQDLIPIPISLQLLSWENNKPSVEIFSLDVDRLNIPDNIKNEIISAYQEQSHHSSALLVTDKINQMINDLMAISYLRKDKDHYHTDIIIEDGIFKINGSPLFPESPAPLPSPIKK